jgi:hypothetical protein
VTAAANRSKKVVLVGETDAGDYIGSASVQMVNGTAD